MSDRSLINVRTMFEAAEQELRSDSENQRKDQLKWRTLVTLIRKQLKEAKDNG